MARGEALRSQGVFATRGPLRFFAESFGRVATCWGEGCSQAFLQPGVRRAVLGGCVCEMRFLQASAAQQGCWCICTAAGWFLGRREARGDRFCKDSCLERHWLLTSSVAALSAEDLTVRRGATRPVAPCRARAIAAHFMIAQLRGESQHDVCGHLVRCALRVVVNSGPILLSEALLPGPRRADGSSSRFLVLCLGSACFPGSENILYKMHDGSSPAVMQGKNQRSAPRNKQSPLADATARTHH